LQNTIFDLKYCLQHQINYKVHIGQNLGFMLFKYSKLILITKFMWCYFGTLLLVEILLHKCVAFIKMIYLNLLV